MKFSLTLTLSLLFVASSAFAGGANSGRGGIALFSSSKFNSSQEKGRIFSQILKNSKNEPITVLVSLSRQRAYLFVGNQVAIDTPISSGRSLGMTPEGDFKITQKDPDHRSNIYGNFVDNAGRIIKAGVDSKHDSAPSGTHFEGAPMLYFMRLTDKGVGMHVGYLPGYPASHGCIRLPEEMAKAIYEVVSLNTPVTVQS
ncbi:MAG: L,D-transpeptidase family protein [Chthoniobacterales bacterium]|nr:L,D-transpeptidase family protein [Chthoniobacterales bacterium]